jgi:hypothetical protein
VAGVGALYLASRVEVRLKARNLGPAPCSVLQLFESLTLLRR